MFAPPVKPKSAPPQRFAVAAQRPGPTSPGQAQLLQRTIGNQALARLLAQRTGAASNARGPIQAKLKVSAVNDPLEHEADQVADAKLREDETVARRRGQQIAKRIRNHTKLSKEVRAKINRELGYFEGRAKDAYLREVRPALIAVQEIAMPEEQVERPAPRPIDLSALVSDPGLCGGSRCMTDEEIYAPLKRSEAEDRTAEHDADSERRTRYLTRQAISRALEDEVDRTQRGTRQHRYALKRLETFNETGQDPGPHVNYDGGPSAVNTGLPVMIGTGLAFGEFAAAFPTTAAIFTGATLVTSAGEALTQRSAGGLNPMRLIFGDIEIGRKLSRAERFLAGYTAALTLLGMAFSRLRPAMASGSGSSSGANIVAPVFRLAERDLVIVETSSGRQCFYRSTGINSGMKGKWLPVDETLSLPDRKDWFNKWNYTEDFPEEHPLHRLGTEENSRISDSLTNMSIPEGAPLESGKHMNDILDFFGAQTNKYNLNRPELE